MRLDPVYLVAPKKKPPSIPTRRAFLIAGGTFLAGAAAGSACGYSSGSANVGAQPDDDALKTGNAGLDELRRLALKAPIEELYGKWFTLLSAVNDTYTDDTILWGGVKRICDELINNNARRDRRQTAAFAIHVISYATSTSAESLRPLLNDLRLIR
jgi:hypothetical protein